MAAGRELVVVAVQRFQAEVPSLAKLKLVADLELTSGGVTAPAASERYRIEVPGPKVSEGEAEDARLKLTIPKSMFALLAEEGSVADWKDAFYYGHLKVVGDVRVKRLLGRAIDSTT